MTQTIYPGVDWRTDSSQTARLFATFLIVKELHELIWALLQLAALCPDADLRTRLHSKAFELEQLTFQGEQVLDAIDVTAEKRANRELADLVEVARSGAGG